MKLIEEHEKKFKQANKLYEDLTKPGVNVTEVHAQLAQLLEELEILNCQIKAENDDYLEKQSQRIDSLEEALNTPIFTSAGGGRGEKAHSWTDEHGREFKSVRGKQRLSNLHGREENPFGAIVKGILTGSWTSEAKSMMVSIDPSAGYITRPDLSNYVIDLARDKSPMANAGCPTFELPDGVQSTAYLRHVSDPTAAWVAEGVEIPESTASFGLLEVKPKKMGILIELTRESVTAFNGAKVIEDVCAKIIAQEMDRVVLMGSGAGQEPIGINATTGTGTITGVGDVHYDDILNAIKTVENANFTPTGGIWSPSTAYELSVLKEAETLAYLRPPEAFTALPKFITKKATDALAFVGQWDQIGWVVGGLQGGLRIEYGNAGSNFKKDCVYLRVIFPMDTICLNPGAFCVLSGLS